jgi:hypothetical protein
MHASADRTAHGTGPAGRVTVRRETGAAIAAAAARPYRTYSRDSSTLTTLSRTRSTANVPAVQPFCRGWGIAS